MASNKIEIENSSDVELKHLGFVRMIARNALVCLLSLYEYAKQNSGPLKPTVGTVETAVASVVGPVYDIFKSVPGDVLVYVDKKADEVANKFDEHAPPLAKLVVSKGQSMVEKASNVAQNIANEAVVGGPYAAINYTGALYKQLVLNQMAKAWYRVNQIPPFQAVAKMAVPTAVHWSEKYNMVIADMAAKGNSVFSYLPSVPIDEMAKAYKLVEALKGGDATTCDKPESETD